MSKVIKNGICTCGCAEQQLRQTTSGRLFSQVGGLGIVEFDHDAEYDLRVWDEYFENTETFAGETPVDYAVQKSWQNFNLVDVAMPKVCFEEMITNLRAIFTPFALDILVDRDRFKEILGKADHGLLGNLVYELDIEVHRGQGRGEYKTLTYWERNAIGSYAYVWSTGGKFKTSKIAHNVRILLMQQYTLCMITLAKLKLERNKELI